MVTFVVIKLQNMSLYIADVLFINIAVVIVERGEEKELNHV